MTFLQNSHSSLRPILVVEDNDMDLDFCLQAFEENAVANPVIACRDGEEALQFIDAHPSFEDRLFPLLVLLDLRLPKVDGIVDFGSFPEVVKSIKMYWVLTNEPPFSSTGK